MPEVKLKELKECSYQDDKYPAQNLMRGEKWLVSSRAITYLSATFQLSKSCCISSVHIGNSGSAFIFLQVKRMDCADFQDLLPYSALMTPQESKNGKNTNSVKIYNKVDFLEATREGEWNQLKVTVTQPFNHQMHFGLCFLHVFSFLEEDYYSSTETTFNFSRWEKMRNLSPSNTKLSRKERLMHDSTLSPSRYQDEEKKLSTVKKTCEEVDETVFEASVTSFLESLKLKDKDLDNIQLVDLRKKMEKVNGHEFSSKEKQLFVATVKKFVVSMKSSDTFHSSSKEASVNKKKSKLMQNCGRVSLNFNTDGASISSGSGWLTAKKVDNINTHEKSPSVRRNVISLEDSNENKIRGQNGTSNYLEQSRRVGDANVVYLNTKLKRKCLTVEEDSIKHHKLSVNELPFKILDIKETESRSSGRENLVECPICKIYFEADSIESHSSECTAFTESVETEVITCPMCSKKICSAVADVHANICASEMFGD